MEVYLTLKHARPLWTNHGCNIVYLEGGRAGGKTEAICERLIGHALEEPGVGILYLRHEKNSIDDSIKVTLEDAIDRMGVREQFMPKQRSEIHAKNGSHFRPHGMQHSPTSIKGRTKYKYFFVDEGADITRAEWRNLLPTIRRPGAILYIAINPTRIDDPLYADFHVPDEKTGLIPIDDALMLKFRWQDLEYLKLPDGEWLLSRSLLKVIKRMYQVNPDEAEHVYGGGLAIRQDAIIFQRRQHWVVGTTNHRAVDKQIRHVEVPYHAETRYGIDYPGGAHTPGVVLRCRVWEGRVHVEAEIVKKRANDHDIKKMIAEIINGPNAEFFTDHNFRLSAGQARGWGYDVKLAIKGPNSIIAGIRWLQSHFITVEPSCQNLIRELSTWSYKVDRSTEEVKEPPEPLPVGKDSIDALRYSVSEKIVGRKVLSSRSFFGLPLGNNRLSAEPVSNSALKRRLVG